MNEQDYNSSVSGYLTDGFEGINRNFTDIEILHYNGHHILARAKRYGRWWMLKAIKEEEAGQTAYQQMLRKEFDILMHLQSPHIVQATGMELVEGLGMCIVMEYVDGIQLNEWLKEPKCLTKRFQMTVEFLKAVEYIHSIGTVHRDLKPENIMVTRNGENIKLIDFGLADNDHMAILKQPAGTPQYMAPEQTSFAIPDIRNDIYSIGIILRRLIPERKYKPVIDKCFLPIEKRYKNVNDLLHALQRQTKQRQRITISAFVLLIVLLAAGLGVQTSRLYQLESKRIRINTAIEEGVKKIDFAFAESQKFIEKKMDTCTSISSINEDKLQPFLRGSKIANDYIDSISILLSDNERFEIITALTIHCNEKLKGWSNKIDSLTIISNKKEGTTLH